MDFCVCVFFFSYFEDIFEQYFILFKNFVLRKYIQHRLKKCVIFYLFLMRLWICLLGEFHKSFVSNWLSCWYFSQFYCSIFLFFLLFSFIFKYNNSEMIQLIVYNFKMNSTWRMTVWFLFHIINLRCTYKYTYFQEINSSFLNFAVELRWMILWNCIIKYVGNYEVIFVYSFNSGVWNEHQLLCYFRFYRFSFSYEINWFLLRIVHI